MNDVLVENLARYIGQTVTIFTTSGGCSGCGFTGVLAAVGECSIKLITNIGAAPACPIGSTCSGYDGGCNGNYGGNNNYGGYCNCNFNNGCNSGCSGNYGGGYNWLGSVTEIPICKIASFTHNAI